jgi:hypothetical protein
MSYRAAKPDTPRMPDAVVQPPEAAPMPKRAQLPPIEHNAPDASWQRIITCMHSPEGRHLMICQREFATRAWINAGRPLRWTPPGFHEDLDESARELLEERRAMRTG